MPFDVERSLHRVVADAFADDTEIVYDIDPKSPHVYRVRLSAIDGRRTAGIQASYEWFEARIFDLDVSVTLFDYDDEEKEAYLRELALVVRAYLRGDGQVEHRRRRFRRRPEPVLVVELNDRVWQLGRRVSLIPNL